jgi:membrane fusion protein, multidrug efflux system
MNAEQHTSELVDQGSAEERQTPRMNSGQEEKSAQPPQEKGKRKGMLTIFAAILVIAAIGGLLYWLHARHYEDTDDAQIDGNLSPIGTRIDGTVDKVYVQNNQMVKVGDPLVDLDPRDNQIKADQVQAQLAQARKPACRRAPQHTDHRGREFDQYSWGKGGCRQRRSGGCDGGARPGSG